MRASEKLLAWRLSEGISQRAAALRAGMSQSAWAEYETEKKVPSIDQAVAISRVTKGGEHHVAVEDWAATAAERTARKEATRRRRARAQRAATGRRPSTTPPRAA